MAHQDVVPVNKDSIDRWTYEPFSGHLDSDGWIWGRGAADCKNTVSFFYALLLFSPPRG
jgi:Gly-Xaa carboxypeptidase